LGFDLTHKERSKGFVRRGGVPSTSIEYTISVPCGGLVDSSQIVIAAAMTAPKHKKKTPSGEGA